MVLQLVRPSLQVIACRLIAVIGEVKRNDVPCELRDSRLDCSLCSSFLLSQASLASANAVAQKAMASIALTRWGGTFVAWDCLSTEMLVPYESHYKLDDILTGQVRCHGGNFPLGAVIAAVLIAAHIVLLLTPAVFTALLLKVQPRLEAHVRSFTLVIISMFAFMLASAGEIAQHIFDNWLYIDSRVSTYNFVFYFMTTASNAILAAGLGTSKAELFLASAACSATPISFFYAVLKHEVYMPTEANIPVWAGMFITVMLFLYRACKLQLPRNANKLLYTGIILVANAFGVFFAVKIVSSGYQAWHLLTASSFCVGFVIEGVWVLQAGASKQLGFKSIGNGVKDL